MLSIWLYSNLAIVPNTVVMLRKKVLVEFEQAKLWQIYYGETLQGKG